MEDGGTFARHSGDAGLVGEVSYHLYCLIVDEITQVGVATVPEGAAEAKKGIPAFQVFLILGVYLPIGIGTHSCYVMVKGNV